MINQTKRILHVDMNSYFATLLQQENPALRGKPVGVVKDAGRICIIAASKEAKALGITTGSRAPEAKVKVPDLVLVPAQFAMYLDATIRLKQLFHTLCPNVSIFSLDEAFLDITDCQRIYPDAREFGAQIQKKVKQTLGSWVTCNVGISYTRFLAKLASEVSPKGGVVEITPENKDCFFADAAFSSVCGVGFRLEHKLQTIGVTNLYLLRFVSDDDLLRCVGPWWTKQLRLMERGNDPALLSSLEEREAAPMKSVGRSITLFKPCADPNAIDGIVYNLVTEIIHKVRSLHLCGRQLFIVLTAANNTGQSFFTHLTLKRPIDCAQEMRDLAKIKLEGFTEKPFPVIRVALRLSLLEPAATKPVPLFSEDKKIERLQHALDKVNSRFGLFSIINGAMLGKRVIRPEVTGFFGDRKFFLQ